MIAHKRDELDLIEKSASPAAHGDCGDDVGLEFPLETRHVPHMTEATSADESTKEEDAEAGSATHLPPSNEPPTARDTEPPEHFLCRVDIEEQYLSESSAAPTKAQSNCSIDSPRTLPSPRTPAAAHAFGDRDVVFRGVRPGAEKALRRAVKKLADGAAVRETHRLGRDPTRAVPLYARVSGQAMQALHALDKPLLVQGVAVGVAPFDPERSSFNKRRRKRARQNQRQRDPPRGTANGRTIGRGRRVYQTTPGWHKSAHGDRGATSTPTASMMTGGRSRVTPTPQLAHSTHAFVQRLAELLAALPYADLPYPRSAPTEHHQF